MTRVILSENCGNSPKNNLIQQLTVAFAKRDVKFILDTVTDTIQWNIVGGRLIEGKSSLSEFLKQSKNNKVSLLTIRHIASHGKAGAVDGIQTLMDGKLLAFCDIYGFGNSKGTLISEVTSYVIPIG
jgi:hypothetical protein